MDRQRELLKQVFGYETFRQGQRELVDAQLQGRDVFGIMPTGGGKSICYQIPALMSDGITLVISPLISLMKDQVLALKNAGVSAAFINSSLTPEQIRLVYHHMSEQRYKIIYVAPERLLTGGFLRAVAACRVSLVAVDEAHCISQWGQDFRPSYLKIVEFLDALGYRPVVSAFTATATKRVQEDVVRILRMNDPLCVVTGFDRPNLRFEVMQPKQKLLALQTLLAQRKGKSGIVYCSTRKDVEHVCEMLRENGYAATRYHAGLEEDERHRNQDDFVYDRADVMVATNAFGMGIDKSNVAYVIHYNMPGSLEAYYQEAGRAGRDGADADCVLLFGAKDVQTAKFFIHQPPLNDELTEAEHRVIVRQSLERLDAMVGYCKTTQCLRGYILDYFGQRHAPTCDNCGNCAADMENRDITTEAKMVLSCVKRIQMQLGYAVGEALVARCLHGSRDKRLLDMHLDTLSTYGLMAQTARSEIRAIITSLMDQGYLRSDEHGAVTLTANASAVLFQDRPVTMRVRVEKKAGKAQRDAVGKADAGLLAALKALRTKLAARQSVPAYVIFSNATLEDMAAKAPATMDEFLTVSGVGDHKAVRYGKAFLEEIERYKNDDGSHRRSGNG